ncbi:MAG: DUF3145 domain-containing protein [Candidatus Nanopelagicales bacterium]
MADHAGTRTVPAGARVMTRGVVFVHSCPRALAAHVEWALADALGGRVTLDWTAQPVEPGSVRAELSWTGPAGTASQIVSLLHAWSKLRVEVTEEPTATTEGRRYSVTPTLGIFRATVGIHGDIQVPEERLRGAVARAALSGAPLETEIAALLGSAWDAELEPFRYAGEGAPVRWLHQVV